MIALLISLTLMTGCIGTSHVEVCMPSATDMPELYYNGMQVGPDLNSNGDVE